MTTEISVMYGSEKVNCLDPTDIHDKSKESIIPLWSGDENIEYGSGVVDSFQ